MKKRSLNLKVDSLTYQLIEQISDQEGVSKTEIIRLLVRAWRMGVVFDKDFPLLTTWMKAKVAASLVKTDLDNLKKG